MKRLSLSVTVLVAAASIVALVLAGRALAFGDMASGTIGSVNTVELALMNGADGWATSATTYTNEVDVLNYHQSDICVTLPALASGIFTVTVQHTNETSPTLRSMQSSTLYWDDAGYWSAAGTTATYQRALSTAGTVCLSTPNNGRYMRLKLTKSTATPTAPRMHAVLKNNGGS